MLEIKYKLKKYELVFGYNDIETIQTRIKDSVVAQTKAEIKNKLMWPCVAEFKET